MPLNSIDESIARARAEIGKVRPARAHFTEVTADAIRHFALGIGDDNPLWLTSKYAEASVGSLIAPPTFLWTSFMTPMFFPSGSEAKSTGGGLPGMQALYAGARLRFNRPIRKRDRLRSTSERRGIVDPDARVEGDCIDPRIDVERALAATRDYSPKPDPKIILQIETHSCADATTGEAIGDLVEHISRLEPNAIDPKKGRYGDFRPRKYSAEEMQVIGDHYAQEASHRRGGASRRWEDVKVGDEMPKLVKGPLTILSYTAFLAGAAAFFNLTDRVLYNFASRFPDAIKTDPASGIWLLPEDMHWHPHMAAVLGMPEGFDLGNQRVGWFAHLVTDWMSDAGWLEELDVWFHRPMFLSEAAWISGKVVDKIDSGATTGRVVLELAGHTFDGDLLSRGQAIVALPKAGAAQPVWAA